jgi:hypothetical protein
MDSKQPHPLLGTGDFDFERCGNFGRHLPYDAAVESDLLGYGIVARWLRDRARAGGMF